MQGLTPEATIIRLWIIRFRVRRFYCDTTLEDVIQILEDRGAQCQHNAWEQGSFEVRIPAHLDPKPFLDTLMEADSAITDIDTEEDVRTVIIAAGAD
jgi:hypothetical protein